MQQIKWTERTFHFGYEKGYIPLFIERLSSTAARMEELFKQCSEADLSARVGNGWSAKEHAGHLEDLENLHDGRIDDFIAGLPVLRAADMSNKRTYDAGHNECGMKEVLESFRETRNKFINRIISLDEQYFEVRSMHPRLQQMITITDSLFFIAEHDMHHMAHIARLCTNR